MNERADLLRITTTALENLCEGTNVVGTTKIRDLIETLPDLWSAVTGNQRQDKFCCESRAELHQLKAEMARFIGEQMQTWSMMNMSLLSATTTHPEVVYVRESALTQKSLPVKRTKQSKQSNKGKNKKPTKDSLSPREAADYCGIGYSTLTSYRAQKIAPKASKDKQGRLWYKKTDLDVWKAEREE